MYRNMPQWPYAWLTNSQWYENHCPRETSLNKTNYPYFSPYVLYKSLFEYKRQRWSLSISPWTTPPAPPGFLHLFYHWFTCVPPLFDIYIYIYSTQYPQYEYWYRTQHKFTWTINSMAIIDAYIISTSIIALYVQMYKHLQLHGYKCVAICINPYPNVDTIKLAECVSIHNNE